MNRKEMVGEIRLMVDDMKNEFEDAKIKAPFLELPEEAEKFPRDMIEEGFMWLLEIWNNQYAAVRTVRNLLTHDQWERYKLWESFNRTQEMKLLREKQVPFRKAIISRERPALFKKGEQNGQRKAVNTKKGD